MTRAHPLAPALQALNPQSSQALVLVAGAPDPALDLLPLLQAHYEELTYVGVDRGTLRLLEAGLSLRWGIGDFDSLTPEEEAYVQSQVSELYRLPAAKDQTDLQAALDRVLDQEPDVDTYFFGVLGSGSGRLSHLMANLWLGHEPRYQKLLERTWLVEDQVLARFLWPGAHSLASLPGIRYVSFISMTPVTGWTIQGAEYALDNEDFSIPQALISNEFREGQPIEVSFQSGQLLALFEVADR